MPTFPSAEWLDRYREAINASDAYREAAKDWEGDITYVIEAEPAKGVSEDVYAWVDLWHGECRDAKILPAEEGAKAKFIILAPYSRWKEVIRGEVEPIKGMMQGKLKLRGDLPTIARYVKAAEELVNIAGSIPTEFADES